MFGLDLKMKKRFMLHTQKQVFELLVLTFFIKFCFKLHLLDLMNIVCFEYFKFYNFFAQLSIHYTISNIKVKQDG